MPKWAQGASTGNACHIQCDMVGQGANQLQQQHALANFKAQVSASSVRQDQAFPQRTRLLQKCSVSVSTQIWQPLSCSRGHQNLSLQHVIDRGNLAAHVTSFSWLNLQLSGCSSTPDLHPVPPTVFV